MPKLFHSPGGSGQRRVSKADGVDTSAGRLADNVSHPLRLAQLCVSPPAEGRKTDAGARVDIRSFFLPLQRLHSGALTMLVEKIGILVV